MTTPGDVVALRRLAAAAMDEVDALALDSTLAAGVAPTARSQHPDEWPEDGRLVAGAADLVVGTIAGPALRAWVLATQPERLLDVIDSLEEEQAAQPPPCVCGDAHLASHGTHTAWCPTVAAPAAYPAAADVYEALLGRIAAGDVKDPQREARRALAAYGALRDQPSARMVPAR